MQQIYEYLISKTKTTPDIGLDKLLIDNSVTPKYKDIIEFLLPLDENNVLGKCKYWETKKGLHIVYNNHCIYPEHRHLEGVQFIVNIDKLKAEYVLSYNGVYVGGHSPIELPDDDINTFLDALSEEINKIKPI